ncbi:hypothetical protein HPK19_07905 [Arthrobacter citreus]|nr:hypothetical protein HPK19_07905 [Arthrobacter citreus]
MKKIIRILCICILFALIIPAKSAKAAGNVKPGMISNLQVSQTGQNITLTWNAASDAVNGYVIIRESATEISQFGVNAGATSFTDKIAFENTDYKYSVYGLGPNREYGEAVLIDVHTKSDQYAPDKIRNIQMETINKEAHITWDDPFNWDYKGVSIYDKDGDWVTDVEVGDKEIHFYDLKENTSYTFYFFSYDQKGNEQSLEEGAKVTFKTTYDKKSPGEINNAMSWRKGNDLIFSWDNPRDEDFVETIITLPNGKKIKYDYDKPTTLTYKPTSFTGITTVKFQTVDWNGNVSKGKTILWEDSSRPPVEAKNIKFKDANGVITISFTPANEYDYKATIVTLPNGSKVTIPKGKNSFIYKGSTIVGKVYGFTFKSMDSAGNISKGIKVNFAPKAITVNKSMKTKIKTYLRTSASSSGKKIKTLYSNTSVKVLSKGYGSGRAYSYVQIGSKKGYVVSSHLK